MKINERVKLQKISDDVYNGNHPNGVYEGDILSGYVKTLPVIGEQFYMYDKLINKPVAWTSKVVALNEDVGVIKTKNSTYKILNE